MIEIKIKGTTAQYRSKFRTMNELSEDFARAFVVLRCMAEEHGGRKEVDEFMKQVFEVVQNGGLGENIVNTDKVQADE